MTIEVPGAIGRARLVPVIELEDPSMAAGLGTALTAGGLPVAEVTFRTARAQEAIEHLRSRVAGLTVGAGTVLTRDQVDAAADAGAMFIVAPGFNPSTVDRALERQIPVIPGVCTPTEIERALAMGLTTLKFFPAAVAGGPAFLQAISAVYPAVGFIPTGGISPDTLESYLRVPNVIACGGSWMVPRRLLSAGAFDQIEGLVSDSVARVRMITGGGPEA